MACACMHGWMDGWIDEWVQLRVCVCMCKLGTRELRGYTPFFFFLLHLLLFLLLLLSFFHSSIWCAVLLAGWCRYLGWVRRSEERYGERKSREGKCVREREGEREREQNNQKNDHAPIFWCVCVCVQTWCGVNVRIFDELVGKSDFHNACGVCAYRWVGCLWMCRKLWHWRQP